jgi:hypothetical protein
LKARTHPKTRSGGPRITKFDLEPENARSTCRAFV